MDCICYDIDTVLFYQKEICYASAHDQRNYVSIISSPRQYFTDHIKYIKSYICLSDNFLTTSITYSFNLLLANNKSTSDPQQPKYSLSNKMATVC